MLSLSLLHTRSIIHMRVCANITRTGTHPHRPIPTSPHHPSHCHPCPLASQARTLLRQTNQVLARPVITVAVAADRAHHVLLSLPIHCELGAGWRSVMCHIWHVTYIHYISLFPIIFRVFGIYMCLVTGWIWAQLVSTYLRSFLLIVPVYTL